MMVLGDFLKCCIAPLQQRSRMACMYMGINDYCRIARGPDSEFTRAELEYAIRVMTGEAFSLESLVLPSGIKALCEDQALWSAVLASMRTLDEGGLAVGQVGDNPNRGSTSLVPHPTASSTPAKVLAGPAMEVRPPLEGERRRRWCRSTATRTMCTPPRPGGMTRRRERPRRGAAKRRGARPGGSNVVTTPSWGSRPQAPEVSGAGETEQSCTTSAATPAAGGEAGGGAVAFFGAADSSASTDDTAPSDTTTTVEASSPSPVSAARGAYSGRHPPEDQGDIGGKRGLPDGPGRLGVA
jgi:hypothetical protein